MCKNKEKLKRNINTGLSVFGVVLGIVGTIIGIVIVATFIFIGFKLYEFLAPAL